MRSSRRAVAGAQRAERLPFRTASRGQSLEMTDAERSGLVVFPGEHLGELHELVERLAPLIDLLFENGAMLAHRATFRRFIRSTSSSRTLSTADGALIGASFHDSGASRRAQP